MSPIWYIYDKDGIPIAVPASEATVFLEKHRVVKKTKILDMEVSTVFLGIDHNFGYEGPPVLWETMVFGGKLEHEIQERYTSQEEAIKGHEEICKYVLNSLPERTRYLLGVLYCFD